MNLRRMFQIGMLSVLALSGCSRGNDQSSMTAIESNISLASKSSEENTSVNKTLLLNQIRSATIYDISLGYPFQPAEFERRLIQAKSLGFNTIWWVVQWRNVESDVGSNPNFDINSKGYDGKLNMINVVNLGLSLDLLKKHGLNLMWSVNYLGRKWSPVGVDPVLLNIGNNRKFLLRYTKFIAGLIKQHQMSNNTFMLFHDEGVLAPYDYLREYPEIQQGFRRFLYAKNSNLSYWNSRWGTNYSSWSQIETYSFNKSLYIDPRLQDMTSYINWYMSLTIGNGSFPDTVKNVAPSIRVGFHYTNFNFLNTKNKEYLKLNSPLSAHHRFDFVSFALYDNNSNMNPFAKTAKEYLAAVKPLFPSLPIFFGEVGSAVCATENDCPMGNQFRTASATVQNRQAKFLEKSILELYQNEVGFNVWELVDYNFTSHLGLRGLFYTDNRIKPSGVIVSKLLKNPTITTSGVGCTKGNCIWIRGANFSENCSVNIYAGNWNPKNPLITLTKENWRITCTPSVISFEIPSNILSTYDSVNVVVRNVGQRTWSNPKHVEIH